MYQDTPSLTYYDIRTGGDSDLSVVTTLPNILRQYNPNLFGFSTGVVSSDDYLNFTGTRLNVAESGAITSQMLGQAMELVTRMRASDNIDFENDWKLVTINIGSNDLCQLTCQNDPRSEPEAFIRSITDTLDYLRDNLPRTFVNLVQLVEYGDAIRAILSDSSVGERCAAFVPFVCPCGPSGINATEEFDNIAQQYQENLQRLVDSSRYDQSDNYTVVLQPFLTNIDIFGESGVGIEFFAVDCTHIGATGNRLAATALWNNMLQRVGEKSTILREPVELSCPTNEDPFLFTAQNSSELEDGGLILFKA